MDDLHQVLRSIRPQTKSGPDHLDVFREFLAHLDLLQRHAPRVKMGQRKRAAKRARG